MTYVPVPYPAWRYHNASGRTCIVESPAQDAALSKQESGWTDRPPASPPPPPPAPPVTGATDVAPAVPADVVPEDPPAAEDVSGDDDATPKKKRR